MSDEKPKHKPQQKHTLSEVLKSLQDLIRTDLIPGPKPPPAGTAPPRPPPSPAEADSFHDALEHLDRMITERIIEPVERAREEPPEPLLPDETLEIEWDETQHAERAAEEARALEADLPAPDGVGIEEIIELEGIPDHAGLDPEPTPVDGTEPEPGWDEPVPAAIDGIDAADPVVDLTAAPLSEELAPREADDAPTGEPERQHAFDFSAPGATPDPRPETEPADGGDSVAAAEPAPEPEIVILDRSLEEPESGAPPAQPTPPAPPEQRTNAADELKATDAVPPLVVEYTGATTDASDEGGDAAPRSAEPGTNRAASDTETEPVKSRSRSESTPGSPRHAAESPDAPTAAQDIPVLQDVADLSAPPAPPLPDAAQARDIAIRVIARLNIERRKAGESPLDIKTIERLQQYLADALTKRALNKPK